MEELRYIFELWKFKKELKQLHNFNSSKFGPDLSNENTDAFFSNKQLLLNKSVNIETSQKSINIYASLVPDILLNCDSTLLSNINPCVAVLMYVDISGFTPLSEKCAQSGNDGVFKLTSIVNEFFGKMVTLIYQLDGDIWKFSGDAFLAMWKVEMSDYIGLLIHKALLCALHIQKNLGCYPTEFGIALQVKIGMSMGNVIWTMVGDQSSRRSIMVGRPINEIKTAEKLCSSGEVIVSASMWAQMSPNDCVYQVLENGLFIKVIRVLGYLGLQSPKLLKLVGAPNINIQIANSTSSVRNFSRLNDKGDVCSFLRLCILPLVAQQIDADVELNYINELRTLTLMFVNIIPKQVFHTELIEIVEKAYNVISSLVQNAGGLMEKVSMFDKDIVFLTVFGLRGFCDNELISACLHAGYDIREACISIKGIQTISVGITTGLAYCGVVGNPLRREFTVMGPAVNKAARIMCEFLNAVTCDAATYIAAQLPSYYFNQHQQRRLRGFSSDDVSYEFIANKMSTLHSLLTSGMPPLLGRNKEMDLFRRIAESLNGPNKNRGAIVISGEEKCGKSRLLDEMVKELHVNKFAPIVVGLRIGHSFLPYGSAIHILSQVFQLNNEHLLMELNTKLKQLLHKELTSSELEQIQYLFEYEQRWEYDQIIASTIQKRIFVSAIQQGMKNEVLAVDDIHLCDAASWQMIDALIQSHCKLVILTRRGGFSSYNIPDADVELAIKLEPLDSVHVAPLACQILGTQAVDLHVVKFLEKRCNGSPGWCKSYLETLMRNKCVAIKHIEQESLDIENMVHPPVELVTPLAIHVDDIPTEHILINLERREMDLTEFFYQDLKSTINVMTQQEWCRKIQKSLISRTELLRRSISQDDSSIASSPLDTLTTFSKMNESKHWPGLVRSMFITESPLCLKLEENPISIHSTYVKSLIDESVFIFERTKYVKPRVELAKNDMKLDTLKIQQNMMKFPEMRKSSKIINNQKSVDEQIDSSTRLVIVCKPFQRSADISKNLSQNGDVLCIIKIVDYDLNEIKLDSHVNFLSIFDSLKPFEQLVLKCAAIIGIKFSRQTLEAILHYPDSSLISLAIMRLIDLEILWCTQTLKLQSNKKCACQHLLADLSLPYYAFCRHLAFRYPSFKTVVYDILPPNQKKLFHKRAVECLSTEGIQCLSCFNQESQINTEIRRFSSILRKSITGISTQQISVAYTKVCQTLLNVRWPNMVNCTCCFVENQVLHNIIQQCEAADLHGETIKFKVKYAKAYIKKENISEVEEIANQLLIDIKTNSELLSLEERKMLTADLEILLSEVNVENGKLDVAFINLLKAVSYILPLKIPIAPWPFLHIYLQIFSKLWLNLKGQEGHARIAANALIKMVKILMVKEKFKDAQVVNSACLKILEKTNDLKKLCTAYGNQVDILLSMQGSLDDFNSEIEMINLSHKMIPIHSIPEALALGRLIHAIYIRRVMGTGDLTLGSDLLQAMTNLNNNIPATCNEQRLVVESIHILTMLGKIKEAVAQIMLLRNGGKSQLWFHVLCLDFFRITGYWIEDPEESIYFIEKALKKQVPKSTIYKRAILALHLWLLWTKPRDVSSPIILPQHPQPIRNITDCICRLEELMALVLQGNVASALLRWSRIGRILRSWITDVGVMSYTYKVMLPSYLHFKAYILYRMENNVPRAKQVLAEAMQVAREQGNELMIARITLTGETLRLADKNHALPHPSKGKNWTEWKKEDWISTLMRLP